MSRKLQNHEANFIMELRRKLHNRSTGKLHKRAETETKEHETKHTTELRRTLKKHEANFTNELRRKLHFLLKNSYLVWEGGNEGDARTIFIYPCLTQFPYESYSPFHNVLSFFNVRVNWKTTWNYETGGRKLDFWHQVLRSLKYLHVKILSFHL